MVWYSHLVKNFPQFVVTHTVKGFDVINKTEVDVFLAFSCFFYDPTDVGNLIPGSLYQEPENQRSNQQWPQDWKRSVFIPIPKKGNAKECSNYRTIVLISHTSKIMLKILQVRPQQYVNHELPDVQAGFRKGRGTRDQIVNIRWIIEKASEF